MRWGSILLILLSSGCILDTQSSNSQVLLVESIRLLSASRSAVSFEIHWFAEPCWRNAWADFVQTAPRNYNAHLYVYSPSGCGGIPELVGHTAVVSFARPVAGYNVFTFARSFGQPPAVIRVEVP